MSKKFCIRQNHVICEFCKSELFESCKTKRCLNLNLPKGSGLYLFDKVKTREDDEEKGIYELWLKEYHNIHKTCSPEPAKVDYIFFYPSQRTILLIEVSDLYRDWINFLKNKLRSELWHFFEGEVSIKTNESINSYLKQIQGKIKTFEQLRDFLQKDLTDTLKQHIDPEKVAVFQKKFLSKIDDFIKEFILQIKNELIKKIDDTLRTFEIFFEKIGKSQLFNFYLQNFRVQAFLMVSPRGYNQIIFSIISRIKIERLKYKWIICDNCQSMENFQRNLLMGS